MKVCGIVLNYRDAARTERCLSSLAGQGLEKLLIVDNSADDRLADELSAVVARQMKLVDYALHQLTPSENLGFACGVHLALGSALARDCDTFLLINNDAVAMPGMLRHLVAELAVSDAAIAAPTLIDAAGIQQPMYWYQRYFGLLTVRPLPGSFSYMSGCCLLIRREMLVNARLFDEDFFMYGEDTFLGWQLACAGKKPLRLREAVVFHEGAGSSRRGQFFYEYHMARAHVLLAIKTKRHLLEIPLLLACKLMGLGVRGLWRSLRYRSPVPLLMFLLAWLPLEVRPDNEKQPN